MIDALRSVPCITHVSVQAACLLASSAWLSQHSLCGTRCILHAKLYTSVRCCTQDLNYWAGNIECKMNNVYQQTASWSVASSVIVNSFHHYLCTYSKSNPVAVALSQNACAKRQFCDLLPFMQPCSRFCDVALYNFHGQYP